MATMPPEQLERFEFHFNRLVTTNGWHWALIIQGPFLSLNIRLHITEQAYHAYLENSVKLYPRERLRTLALKFPFGAAI